MDDQNNQSYGQSNSSNNTVMGVLSYLGILVVIPFLVSRNNSFVKFHVGQGLVLLGIEVIVWVLGFLAGPLWALLQIVNLGVLVLSIVGIVNVVQGKEKELPLVGRFTQNLHI